MQLPGVPLALAGRTSDWTDVTPRTFLENS